MEDFWLSSLVLLPKIVDLVNNKNDIEKRRNSHDYSAGLRIYVI